MEIDISPELSPYKQPLLYPPSLEYEGCVDTAAKRHKIFKVVLDVLPSNKSLHTKFKTEERQTYMYARRIAEINSFQDAKEVLLFNKDGDIMDVCLPRYVIPLLRLKLMTARAQFIPRTFSATANG